MIALDCLDWHHLNCMWREAGQRSVHRPGESQYDTREVEKEGNVATEREVGRRREREVSMGSCWPRRCRFPSTLTTARALVQDSCPSELPCSASVHLFVVIFALVLGSKCKRQMFPAFLLKKTPGLLRPNIYLN